MYTFYIIIVLYYSKEHEIKLRWLYVQKVIIVNIINLNVDTGKMLEGDGKTEDAK